MQASHCKSPIRIEVEGHISPIVIMGYLSHELLSDRFRWYPQVIKAGINNPDVGDGQKQKSITRRTRSWARSGTGAYASVPLFLY